MQSKEPKRTAPIVFCTVAGVCLASISTAFAELDIALKYLEREKDIQGDDRRIARIYSLGEFPFW
jgi:hypothetical protein